MKRTYRINPYEIKKLRARLSWTQLQLAEKLGVRVRAVSGWERGEHMPNQQGIRQKLLELMSNDSDLEPN